MSDKDEPWERGAAMKDVWKAAEVLAVFTDGQDLYLPAPSKKSEGDDIEEVTRNLGDELTKANRRNTNR